MQSSPPLVCGHLVEKAQFALDPVNYLLRHGTRYDVTRMELPVYDVGTTEYVVVSDPTLAREVLTDGETFEQYSDVRHAIPVENPFGSGSDDDVDWTARREAYVDAFSGPSYRAAIEAAERQVAEDVRGLSTDRPHGTSTLMRRLTLRAMAAVLFGRTPPAEVERHVERAADYGATVTNLGLSSFLPVWTPRASLLGVWLQRGPVDRWVADAVDGAPEDALVWTIADALGVEGERLKAAALVPLVAGFVSPEVMLSACLDRLGANPREQTAVERAAATLPRSPTNGDLAACREALRWPLLESLRLYPPTFSVTRRATERATVGDYRVTEGDLVWIDQWSIGRHPEHWDAPDEFAPDRWATRSPLRDALVPFGAGARDCLGKNVALLQGELVLATLFREYDVRIEPGDLSPGTVHGGMSLQFDAPTITLRE